MVSRFFICLFLFTALWLAPVFGGIFHCHGGGKIPGRCRHHFLLRNRCHRDKSNKETKGIPRVLLDEFRLMSQYAAAAYWPGNNNSTGTPLSCSDSLCQYTPAGNCPLVEAAKATTTDEFKDTPVFDDHGFIAVDPTNKLVVLSFRGSHSQQNWITDLHVFPICSDLCKKCAVHQGFWESWVGLRGMIIPNVVAATSANPDYRIIVTGHSLGAALATLAAAEIRKSSPYLMERTELFTFGSPRVGDVETAAFLTKQSSKSYRITAGLDPIPRVPGPIMGYMHMSPEYWIEGDPDDPKPEDVTVLTGYYNRKGNTGTKFRSMDDHRHYFGYVTKCDPNPPNEPSHASWLRFLIEGII